MEQREDFSCLGEWLLAEEKKFYHQVSGGKRIIGKYLGEEKEVTLSSLSPGGKTYGLGSFALCGTGEKARHYGVVRVPDTVKELCRDAFSLCTVDQVILGKDVENIHEDTFGSAVIHGLTVDPENPWYEMIGPILLDKRNRKMILCVSEKQGWKEQPVFRIPEEVRIIGKNALSCGYDGTWVLGKGVELIEEGAFSVFAPKDVRVEGHGRFTVENHCLIDRERKTLLRYLKSEEAMLAFTPQKGGTVINRIGSFAFAGSENLQRLKLPDTVKEVGEYAFCQCSQLWDIRGGRADMTLGAGALFGTRWAEIHNL